MNAIVEDIQNTKLELARKFAEELVGDYDTARLILTLANQAGVLAAERDGLKAARYAYATEFPLDEEGQPDVGSIHQNIRALKAAGKFALDALVSESRTTQSNVTLAKILTAITLLRKAGVQ